MDKNNPNKELRSTPEYAEYQADNFWASNDGKVPPFNTGMQPPISPITSKSATQLEPY
jgi:hypothetical protein